VECHASGVVRRDSLSVRCRTASDERALGPGSKPAARARCGGYPDAPAREDAVPGWIVVAAALALWTPVAFADQVPQSPEARLRQIEAEVERTIELERQIKAEVERQEALMRRMETEESQTAPTSTAPPADPRSLAERADPRAAPRVPADRDLPLAIFEREVITIPKGRWGNARPMKLVRYSLDADRDGKSEEIRYHDPATHELLRMERDRDYDGTLDVWQTYEQGLMVFRALDEDGNGKPDSWERYKNQRMVRREIDRDADGVKDAFFRYVGDSLVEQRHDADNDGRIDLVVFYESRRRVRSEEDRDHNGQMDTWTTFTVVNGTELIARIERDSKDRGKPDVFETFETLSGKPVISRREEDVNGNGKIDITSIYENGKLVRREILDPSLMPPG